MNIGWEWGVYPLLILLVQSELLVIKRILWILGLKIRVCLL